jgi:hypothetical protein
MSKLPDTVRPREDALSRLRADAAELRLAPFNVGGNGFALHTSRARRVKGFAVSRASFRPGDPRIELTLRAIARVDAVQLS